MDLNFDFSSKQASAWVKALVIKMDEASGFFEENSRAHLIVEEEKEFSLDFAVTQKPPLQPKPLNQKKFLL